MTLPDEQPVDLSPTTEHPAHPSPVLGGPPVLDGGQVRWSRYVAIGDSFSEGLWDAPGHPAGPHIPLPPADAPLRGWADQLAMHLSQRRTAAGQPPLEYANLAIRGRLLRPILREQVPVALDLRPDLVSLVGGGNDILRPSVDVDRLARDLEAGVARLRAAGIDVLLGTGMDAAGSPLVRATRARVGVFNAHVWSIARRHGAYVLDLWGMRSLSDWRMWSDDRIHLTKDGHARVAQAALVGLGLAPDVPDWDEPPAPLPPVPRLAQVRDDARWAKVHLYPWATRRLHGTSSGAARTAKRPEATPVEVEPAREA
ncbi:lysophospholipase L1-like esterase [Cellulomonas soli]|nr:lysophospholipase L1-like esterase [Cellulomonas soli]